MKLYIYDIETDEEVDVIEGETNEECEETANNSWGFNDYYWSYTPQIL